MPEPLPSCALPLNLDFITPLLAVGGRYPMEAATHLACQLRVRHVVDVRLEYLDDETVLRACGIEFLHLPTVDTRAIRMDRIHQGVQWVSHRLRRLERVLIHCEHGIGRSALLALCVLVAQGLAPLEALETTKSARVQVSPSPEQLQAFISFCEEWRLSRGASWKPPTLHELGRIAYRHLYLSSTASP